MMFHGIQIQALLALHLFLTNVTAFLVNDRFHSFTTTKVMTMAPSFMINRPYCFLIIPSHCIRKLDVRTRCFSRRGGPVSSKPPFGSFSYIEGEEYDNEIEELEAMGGDPAFFGFNNPTNGTDWDQLSNDSGSNNNGGNIEVMGDGDAPLNTTVSTKWEWDGIVDEEAHLGYD
jgi:hypothetical protein